MKCASPIILIVDDDPYLRHLVEEICHTANYTTLSANDGASALTVWAEQQPDLILLDVGLPHLDGFRVCQRIREQSTVPIIFLSGQSTTFMRVTGLDAGGDDYLVKPFSGGELLARIQAQLRHVGLDQPQSSSLTVGPFTLETPQQRITYQEHPLPLTPTLYHLLAYLLQHPYELLTASHLRTQVWGIDNTGSLHVVQVMIARLRKLIEADPAHPHHLRTRIGFGYQFNPEDEEAFYAIDASAQCRAAGPQCRGNGALARHYLCE